MLRIFFVTLAVLFIAAPALAHPHVWVTMRTELVYAPDGRITGIRHAWSFDDMFSTFAIQGLDSKEKGKFTREELAPLAKVNVDIPVNRRPVKATETYELKDDIVLRNSR